MDICIAGLEAFPQNKVKIIDKRVDELYNLFKSKDKVYAECFFLPVEKYFSCEGMIASKDAALDLILSDMEFIEKKLKEEIEDSQLFEKAYSLLEGGAFLSTAYEKGQITDEEFSRLKEYPFITKLTTIFLEDAASPVEALPDCWWLRFKRGLFFTAGPKDSHAWVFRLGQTALEAAHIIHSDIARGFVRAEITDYDTLMREGSLSAVRQKGLLRLEGKEYIMQDGDWVLFRTTK